ncbi:MAG: VOC family protein [Shimia sp.]
MRLTPRIMFQGQAEGAIALWRRAFPDMSVEATGDAAWTLIVAGQTISVFDSPPMHDFAPTPSWSWMVDVDTSDEVDRLAALLSEGGKTLMPADSYDFAARFAWVEDPYGISWQLRHGAP